LDYLLAKGSPALFLYGARFAVYPTPDCVYPMTLIVLFTVIILLMSWLCHSSNCDS
jgi:hypothetical protein